jgi:hypothetical protein
MLPWPAGQCGLMTNFDVALILLSKEISNSKNIIKMEVFTHSKLTCRHARRFDQE